MCSRRMICRSAPLTREVHNAGITKLGLLRWSVRASRLVVAAEAAPVMMSPDQMKWVPNATVPGVMTVAVWGDRARVRTRHFTSSPPDSRRLFTRTPPIPAWSFLADDDHDWRGRRK